MINQTLNLPEAPDVKGFTSGMQFSGLLLKHHCARLRGTSEQKRFTAERQ